MEFGFSLPGRGPLASPDRRPEDRRASRGAPLRVALRHRPRRAARVLGALGLPVRDRRAVPRRRRPGLPRAARAARATSLTPPRGIRLGTSVLVIPYRNPLVAAKMLATIDVLSQGRVILGAGVGWLREEFEALAAPPFEERGAVTDEYLRLMRAAWTTDPVTFEGRYYSVRDVHVLPKPVQKGGIPVWIGGHTDAAVRRAGAARRRLASDRVRPPGAPAARRVRGQGRAGPRLRRARPGAIPTVDHPHGPGARWRCAARDAKAAGRRAAALPGDGRRGRRRHPALPALGVTHFVFDHVSPELRARPRQHGALRQRRPADGLATGGGRQGEPASPSSGARRAATKRAARRRHDLAQDACALIETPADGLPDLLARAGELRDRGRGRTVTFSTKVFVPLTTSAATTAATARSAAIPGEPGAHTMTPDEVVALAQAGEPARRQGGAVLPRRQAGGGLSRAPRVPPAARPPHDARRTCAPCARPDPAGVAAAAARQPRA